MDNLEGFKRNRGDIFALLQRKILLSLTDAEIKKAPLQVKMMAAGTLYDKERLERGRSTANVLMVNIPDVDRERIQALAAQIAAERVKESAKEPIAALACEPE